LTRADLTAQRLLVVGREPKIHAEKLTALLARRKQRSLLAKA